MQEQSTTQATPPVSTTPESEAILDQSVVMEQLGLSELDQDKQEAFMVQLAELIQARVASRVTDYLSDAQLGELDKLVEAGSEEEAAAFLDTHVSSYGAMVQEEMNRLMDELGQDASEIKRMVSEAVAERSAATS